MFILSEQELHNLKIFLNRITLSAQEIPAYMELIKIFSEPIETPVKEVE